MYGNQRSEGRNVTEHLSIPLSSPRKQIAIMRMSYSCKLAYAIFSMCKWILTLPPPSTTTHPPSHPSSAHQTKNHTAIMMLPHCTASNVRKMSEGWAWSSALSQHSPSKHMTITRSALHMMQCSEGKMVETGPHGFAPTHQGSTTW